MNMHKRVRLTPLGREEIWKRYPRNSVDTILNFQSTKKPPDQPISADQAASIHSRALIHHTPPKGKS